MPCRSAGRAEAGKTAATPIAIAPTFVIPTLTCLLEETQAHRRWTVLAGEGICGAFATPVRNQLNPESHPAPGKIIWANLEASFSEGQPPWASDQDLALVPT